ncbi:MAG: AIDA repeat-containing protein [Lentisphaeria bacterium]|nr:AIDA repeat-containing protein [Lentisphaeria bacterium]
MDEIITDTVEVSSGSTMTGLLVLQDGTLKVLNGGRAQNVGLADGGKAFVSSGGGLSVCTVSAGGTLEILSSGVARDVTVENGGLYVVSSGGSTIRSFIQGGGKQVVYAGVRVISAFVESDGALHISSGALASSPVISEGGAMYQWQRGLSDRAQVYGTLYVSGTAANAESATVFDHGRIEIQADGHGFKIGISSGGALDVKSGGAVNSALVYAGGSFTVSAGAVGFNARVNGGTMTLAGGIAPEAEAGEDAPSPVPGGSASNTTVNSGGSLLVSSGAAADSATVNSGGHLCISAGGTAMEVRENGGYVQVEDGADVTFVPNTIDELLLEKSSATIHSGTTAVNATVNSGGRLEVFSGGTATIVFNPWQGQISSSIGAEIVYLERDANVYCRKDSVTSKADVMDSLDLASEDKAIVYSDGIINGATVNPGGGIEICSGGTANAIVENGGYVSVGNGAVVSFIPNSISGLIVYSAATIHSGTTAHDITVSSGGVIYVSSGGKLTGKMFCSKGAIVSAYEGAVLDFDLTHAEAGAEALVNDISIIQGTPLYTLTVDEDLAPGSYTSTLADGAGGFDGTISVVNPGGDELGKFTVGETVKVGYDDYTLNLTDGTLSLTVEAPDLTPTNLVGTPERVSWDATGAAQYIVEYSADSFDHAIRTTTTGSAMDLLELPAGTYQWRVRGDANSDWAVGEAIVSDTEPGGPPKAVQSNADGSDDIFFAVQDGAWEDIFYAMNAGSLNDWNGTKEIVFAGGKGHIRNLFFGSNDANILCLTDSDIGDAIFVDDEFTGQPETLAEQQARLARIDEIRAGAGDDLIDMTSNRIEYTGDGLTIRGGDGDDIIWANKGDNMLFGDAGDDRLVGASGDDVIAGGTGDDSMHGGGGSDTFTFCDNWGSDTVEQIAGGFVTLWFVSGSLDNWDPETLTYTDGENSVAVRGVGIDADLVVLKFGAGDTPEDAARFAALSGMGAFDAFSSQKVFEESASVPGALA